MLKHFRYVCFMNEISLGIAEPKHGIKPNKFVCKIMKFSFDTNMCRFVAHSFNLFQHTRARARTDSAQKWKY